MVASNPYLASVLQVNTADLTRVSPAQLASHSDCPATPTHPPTYAEVISEFAAPPSYLSVVGITSDKRQEKLSNILMSV